MNFSVPFLPPLQPFGLNCLKCFLSLFLKWTVSPSRLLFPTSTAISLCGRKPQRGLVSWWLAKESGGLISGLNSLLILLWWSLGVPSNLNRSLRWQFTCYEEKIWDTDWHVCGEAVTSQIICNHSPALTQTVHADHSTLEVQAEAQLPKTCLLERQ